jgi:DNA-binding NarL/FixJ family response regulator
MQVKIPCHQSLPVYQALSSKIKELKVLGLSNDNIAAKLKINRKTVGKGLAY